MPLISVSLPVDTLAEVDRLAKADGIALSAWVRGAVMRRVDAALSSEAAAKDELTEDQP